MYSIKQNPNQIATLASGDEFAAHDASADKQSSVLLSELSRYVRNDGDTTGLGLRAVVSTANVTEAAPADSELDAAFGQPSALGNGFVGIVSDNDADTASILCWTSKGAWFHAVGVKSTG